MVALLGRLLPRRSGRAAATVAVLGLLLAGCGGGSSGGDNGGGGIAPDMTAPAKGPTLTISMKDIQFSPKVAVARVGQKVVWVNDDTVQHDVRALKGASFQSALYGPGKSYSFTPKHPGTIEYDCSIHPGMDGVLKVVQ